MIDELGSFDIYPVCGWQDDLWQFENPDSGGGANHMSLNEARKNSLEFGAKSLDAKARKRVRPPLPEEIPPAKK